MAKIVSEFGRYYDEFVEGDVIEHNPGKTITESDNNLFSLLTMNHHPVHLDWNYAADHQHGKVLVVGTLVFSLAVGLTVRDISGKAIANLAYHEVVHTAPVFIGDTIYAYTKVLEKRVSRSKPDRGIVKVETEVINQRKEIVLRFSRSVLIPKKPGK
jgi:acyl dehydratase